MNGRTVFGKVLTARGICSAEPVEEAEGTATEQGSSQNSKEIKSPEPRETLSNKSSSKLETKIPGLQFTSQQNSNKDREQIHVQCPKCEKKLNKRSLARHMRDVHGGSSSLLEKNKFAPLANLETTEKGTRRKSVTVLVEGFDSNDPKRKAGSNLTPPKEPDSKKGNVQDEDIFQ